MAAKDFGAPRGNADDLVGKIMRREWEQGKVNKRCNYGFYIDSSLLPA